MFGLGPATRIYLAAGVTDMRKVLFIFGVLNDSDIDWMARTGSRREIRRQQVLIQEGVLDGVEYERRNAQFFADYKAGTLDILAFLDFQLKPLAEHSMRDLLAWRGRFVEQEIRKYEGPIKASGVSAD